jgi:hypothetical protein
MVFESFSQILDLRLEQVQRREIPIRSERCPLFPTQSSTTRYAMAAACPGEVIPATLLAYAADD